MQKAILVSLLTVGLLASVIGVGTYAYFSDTETSMGNTMTAGTLDLKVNGGDLDTQSTPALITISDLKPSIPQWANPVTLSIVDNPGKLYKKIMVSSSDCETVSIVEPEQQWMTENAAADQNDFYTKTWLDMRVQVNGGDWVTLMNDPQKKISQIEGKWIYLGTYDKLAEVKVQQSFHLDADADNRYQSDKCTFTEVFRVEQTNAPHPNNCYDPLLNGPCVEPA